MAENPEPCECLKRHEHQPPLVLVHVDGGIAEQWYTVPGTGQPEVYILDFDLEAADEDQIKEFVEVATDTLAKFKARGIDTSDLDADVEQAGEVLEDEEFEQSQFEGTPFP